MFFYISVIDNAVRYKGGREDFSVIRDPDNITSRASAVDLATDK